MYLRTCWRTALVVAATSIAACASPTAPEELLTVTTTAPVFSRDSLGFARISLRLSNSGERTVFVPLCGSMLSGTVRSTGTQQLAAVEVSPSPCISLYFAGPLGIEAGQTIMSMQTVRVPPGEYQISVPVSFRVGDSSYGDSRAAFFRIE